MMKSQELMIGNYVGLRPFEAKEIQKIVQVAGIQNGIDYFINDVKHTALLVDLMPLTIDDIYLKLLGFKLVEESNDNVDTYFLSNENYSLSCFSIDDIWVFSLFNGKKSHHFECESVHELQNLIFVLTKYSLNFPIDFNKPLAVAEEFYMVDDIKKLISTTKKIYRKLDD